MAKSKAKRAKNKSAKLNTVETEKAKAVKKGEEEIIEDEELEEVEEVEETEEEVEDETEDEAEDSEDEDSEDDESEDDDEESEDEDDEDEDEEDDESDESEDDSESEDESEEDEEDDEDEDDESEDEDDEESEDEDEEDEEDDDEEEDDKEESKTVKTVVRTKSAKSTKTRVITSKPAKNSKIKALLARKGDESENILTIFKDTKIIGAIIGEIIGTAVVTMIILTLGMFNPLYMILAYVGITLAVVKLSGAHLNPIVTAGMLSSRRISAIRGVIYIVSQVLGAWLGLWVINHFYQAGVASGNIDEMSTVLPSLSAIKDLSGANEEFSFFWTVTMIEFVGAIIIAFFYARAQRVKKTNEVSFAITAAAGLFIAMLLAVIINSNFFMQQGNTFILNPAIGMIYGIFPASAEGFDALMNALMPMIVAYIVFPVLGGIIGFFLSDFASLSQGEDLKDNA